ncbi:MAG: hypothetical protein WDN44_11355 [Sphingomonas sp.]
MQSHRRVGRRRRLADGVGPRGVPGAAQHRRDQHDVRRAQPAMHTYVVAIAGTQSDRRERAAVPGPRRAAGGHGRLAADARRRDAARPPVGGEPEPHGGRRGDRQGDVGRARAGST